MMFLKSTISAAIIVSAALLFQTASADEPSQAIEQYRKEIKPILELSCFACHGNGSQEGGMALDGYDSETALLEDIDLWWKVLKNLRADIMPPNPIFRPSEQEYETLYRFIKQQVFQIDPDHLDPGHITLRRLNRIEYRNTIDDLMGVTYNAVAEFPPDDTGYGFDNIGDVLSISPLLLEKYVHAAEDIVNKAVPVETYILPEKEIAGRSFRTEDRKKNGDKMTFYKDIEVAYQYKAEYKGTYRLLAELEVDGSFDFDPGECKVTFFIDDDAWIEDEFKWHDNKVFHYEVEKNWDVGKHKLSLQLKALTPKDKQINKLDFEINSVTIQGPLEKEHWEHPKNYKRFFPRDEPPKTPNDRREYAYNILKDFTQHAFRRPADKDTLLKLTDLAEEQYNLPGATFEKGIAQTMVAILASPRFLFRFEGTLPEQNDKAYPQVDEYALASRLSYFLWSTMPDKELFDLAGRGELRANLHEQVDRMLKDKRSDAFIENFTGQWLQARDVETIPINKRRVLHISRRESRGKTIEFTKSLRIAMRRETEMQFEYIMKEDRSLLELLDCDYTFLNEELAENYGIEGVEGKKMRKVELADDSPRGGLLTQGTLLTVTSNPTRTSPVKRGLFVLDNILGTPAPAPPPNIPKLEEAANELTGSGHKPTMREIMELHRKQPLCNSCHARFDPIGLSLENFNALGMWRDEENNQPIDTRGKLITGESFQDIFEVKKILVENHAEQYYRCLAEKMLVYATGRGLQYYDEQTVDNLVDRLIEHDGQFSTLMMGIIESAPFQRQRRHPELTNRPSPKPVQEEEPNDESKSS